MNNMLSFRLFLIFLSNIGVCTGALISLIATPLIQTFASHPGYDGTTTYPEGNYTQDWYITTNWINHTIKIDMTTCNIENVKGKCLFDFLYVYDGPDTNSTELLRTCCGTTHTATLTSTTEEMYILFVTDATIADTGFEFEYVSNGITTTTTTTTTTTVAPPTSPADTSTDMQHPTTEIASTSGADGSTSSADPSTNTVSSDTQTDTTSSANTDSSTNTYSGTNTASITNTDYSTNAAHSANVDYNTNTASSTNTAYSTSTDSNTNTVSGTNAAYSTDTASTKISGMLSSDGIQSTRIYTTDLNTKLLEFSNVIVPAISTESSLSSVEVSSLIQTKVAELSTISSASAITDTSYSAQSGSTESSPLISTNTSTPTNTAQDNGKDNTLYIIIACVVTLLLIIIVVVLIVVVYLKKNNKSSTWPQPFVVHDSKTEPRQTQFTHSKLALPLPITPPINTVMPETNLFDLDLPDKETGRGNLLPPL